MALEDVESVEDAVDELLDEDSGVTPRDVVTMEASKLESMDGVAQVLQPDDDVPAAGDEHPDAGDNGEDDEEGEEDDEPAAGDYDD